MGDRSYVLLGTATPFDFKQWSSEYIQKFENSCQYFKILSIIVHKHLAEFILTSVPMLTKDKSDGQTNRENMDRHLKHYKILARLK